MANTAFNPSDKNAGITLSGSNLVATNNNNVQVQGVRAVIGQSAGKYYWECTFGTNTNVCNAVGVCASTTALNLQMNNSVAGSAYAAMVSYLSGAIFYNGSNISGLGTIGNGTLICVALDIDNHAIWFRIGTTGNWNGNASYNPATNTGGLAVANITPAYPLVQVCNTNDAVTANFGDTAFSGGVPGGFISGFPTTPPVLGITGTPQTFARLTAAYSFTVGGTSGTPPYTYSLASGTLPAGITLNSSSGAVSGTPTTVGTSSGIVIRVTDAVSATANLASFSIAVVDATAWNPSDKSAGVTLSNLDRTTAHGSSSGVRAVNGQTLGKLYFEVTATTWAANQPLIGIANASASLGGVSSTSTNGCGLGAGGSIVINGGFPAGSPSLGTRADGNIIGVATDLNTKQAWFRVCPSGNWNGNASYAPGGTGGVDITAIAGSALYPIVSVVSGGAAFTANFGDSTFSGTAPSGFLPRWPATAVTASATSRVKVWNGTAWV